MKTKELVVIAIMIAVSVFLAQFKIFSTVAFDSMPAFLLSLMIGGYAGAFVGFLGHLATALTSGFPLGLPIHLMLMCFMAITQLVFAKAYHYSYSDRRFKAIVASFFAWLVNVVLPLIVLRPFLGSATVFSFVAPLSFACIANVLLAFSIYKGLKGVKISL